MMFGEKLSKLRKEYNYTQEQLAEILEVSRQSVSKWESNIAYPETDKLICLAKLFECSTDYLLKDDCTSKHGEDKSVGERALTAEKEQPGMHQKIIGYILLAVSVMAGILVWIFAEGEEELYIPIPILLSAFISSLICLFVRQKAGYWCVWVATMPLILLSPYVVGLSLLNGVHVTLIVFTLIMALVANKLFAETTVVTSRKKSILTGLGWIALIVLRIFSCILISFAVIDTAVGLLPLAIMDVVIYTGTALLLTYTVCYLRACRKRV